MDFLESSWNLSEEQAPEVAQTAGKQELLLTYYQLSSCVAAVLPDPHPAMYTALLEDASIFFAQGGHSGSWLAAKLGSIRVFETCMGLAPRAVLAPAPHCGVDHEVEFAPVLSALCTFGVDDGGTTIELLLQGAAIPPQHSCSHPHCALILTVLSSSLCLHPHCTIILTLLSSSLHDHPHSVLLLTLLSSSLCSHPHSALILTLLSSSLHDHPHSVLILTLLSDLVYTYHVGSLWVLRVQDFFGAPFSEPAQACSHCMFHCMLC